MFTITWENDPIWLIFFNGFKPPTSYFALHFGDGIWFVNERKKTNTVLTLSFWRPMNLTADKRCGAADYGMAQGVKHLKSIKSVETVWTCLNTYTRDFCSHETRYFAHLQKRKHLPNRCSWLSGAYWIYPDLISIVTTFDTKESDWKSVEFPKQPLPFIPHILHLPYS